MRSSALTTPDLIFNTQSLNLSSTLHSLKRSALSTHNRLASIYEDSVFVESVADAFKLPLVANERCGSWYIPPEKRAGSVYFKSTDGHTGEWGFNMRRLNLQFLDLVSRAGGYVSFATFFLRQCT
jgi:tRNA A64-2'-O-ribosylphosphate transferase